MSNRTDFGEVAQEMIDYFFSEEEGAALAELRERTATELHNAFVAGQEHENRGLSAVAVEALNSWERWVCEHKIETGKDYPNELARIAELRAKLLP